MNIEMAQSMAEDMAQAAQTQAQATLGHILGQSVTYLRCDKDGIVTADSGILQSIYLSDEKTGGTGRKMALVKNDNGAVNVELMTINYTPQIEESYRAAMADVFATSKEGNDKIKAIVDEYNAKVDDIYKMLDAV